MYMSRIRLRKDISTRGPFWQRVGDSYQVHQWIWRLFPEGESNKRPFLYRQEAHSGLPAFYAVSDIAPEDPDGIWHVEWKMYHPKIREGEQYLFSLRANPVRAKRDAEGRLHRHDIVMEEKKRLEKEGVDREEWPPEADLVQEQGLAWLSARAERCGFSLADGHVRTDGYRQHRFYRPKGNQHVRLSSLDFSGLLTVINRDCFGKSLTEGIGPAKSFGCGLLLIKRP